MGQGRSIRLDIEGSEKEVFENTSDPWLKHTKAVILEIHDWLKIGAPEAVFGAVSNYGFQATTDRDNTIFKLKWQENIRR